MIKRDQVSAVDGTNLAITRHPEYKNRMSLNLLFSGGQMIWVILIASAVAIAVFVERLLHYHRAQINSAEFLSGVRNVMKRENVIEAISICDATPGPVARLVKVAILARDEDVVVQRHRLVNESALADVGDRLPVDTLGDRQPQRLVRQ